MGALISRENNSFQQASVQTGKRKRQDANGFEAESTRRKRLKLTHSRRELHEEEAKTHKQNIAKDSNSIEKKRRTLGKVTSNIICSLTPDKDENICPQHPNSENLAIAPTSPNKKRPLSVSPFFPSSPSSTPSKRIEKKSKISILETNSLPSLPHFRPTSPNEFGLIQEKLRHEPWKMLVAVIFLNVTTAKMALPLLAELFKQWPTPEILSQGSSQLIVIAKPQLISKNY